MTPDGRYLLVAGNPGAYVLSAQRLEQGLPRPVVGVLAIPNELVGGEPIEVITSPDGRYAFVSVEDSDEIAVFDLHAAITHGFRPVRLRRARSCSAEPSWEWPSPPTGNGCTPRANALGAETREA